ncbi:MAG: hypothetical protein GPJ22_16330 [Microcystis aeruginosa LL13-03]|jgi:hypothetical protein|nr:hypothetical protein [Microcystis aeruginosa LL13-03]NCR67487.1 hypothetical protein [Microcystis aeruginosa LL11-07]
MRISVKDLTPDNDQLGQIIDLTNDETDLTKGGVFWFAVVGAVWLGYEIGKEAKTNWFK